MNKDGRGRPGRIVLKNQPKLRLLDVLRRRRTTLRCLLNEAGITTYSGLLTWCDRLGVAAPTEADFTDAFPSASRVNDPQEGIIVLEAPIIDERHDVPMCDDVPQQEHRSEFTETMQKKRRGKKDEPSTPTHEMS